METNILTGIVVDCCIKIHTTIGPGCYERVYEELLCYELEKRGLSFLRQLTLPITYETLIINDAYKVDLLLEDRIIIELKSVEHLLPVHYKQLTTYLKMMNIKNGMLLNFKVPQMKEGIHRVFNNFGQ
ncbi:MAG: GxxExxY protein [Sediminibacterium sp.]